MAEATEAAGRPAEEARFEIRAALRLSPSTAGDRTMVALELRDRLGGALSALRAGDITYLQAAHLAGAVRGLPDPEAAAVQDRVLGRAPDQSLGEFKRTVQRAVLTADPASPRPSGTTRRSRPAPSRRCRNRMGCSRSG